MERFLVALLWLGATAAPAQPCQPDIAIRSEHESAEEAALAALRSLVDVGDAYESGGYVIEMNGKFRSSVPVTQRARNAVSYCIVLPRGSKLAAIYHTHVHSMAFSEPDMRNAARAGVPSYIGTIRSRAARA